MGASCTPAPRSLTGDADNTVVEQVDPFTPADDLEPEITADAGFDQVVAPGDLVMLDGSVSVVPDDLSVTIQWTQIDGPADAKVDVRNAATLTPTFVSPPLPSEVEASVISFQLAIRADGVEATDEVSIVVTGSPATAGNDEEPNIDPDGILTLSWPNLDNPTVVVEVAGPTADAESPLRLDVDLGAGLGTPPGGATFNGFDDEQALPLSISLTGDLLDGSFSAVITVFYDEGELGSLPESQLRLHRFDLAAGAWAAVGTIEVSPAPPTTTVGDYGVDTTSNAVWAVVDALGTFAVGIADTAAADDPVIPPVDGGGGGGGGGANPPTCTTDSDGDGTPDCNDGCPADPAKVAAGTCGCGTSETDIDGDGTPDCVDACPTDPAHIAPGTCGLPAGASVATDWDLYMLRLVNRARQNPAGEAAIIGSAVTDSRPPVPPLALEDLVGTAAKNHNDWMHDNLGSIASGQTPDSFGHFQTLDGASSGAPATGTPSYTGVTVGARITAAGFAWGAVTENAVASFSSALAIPVDQARMDKNQKTWWESTGHRSNMLNAAYTAFGHHAEARTVSTPVGGLNPPVITLYYATQNFAVPANVPQTYVLGLVYEDKDTSGDWTPRDVGHLLREGRVGVGVALYLADTATLVASDTTRDNGGFSISVGDGTYDVVLISHAFPGGPVTVEDVVVSGSNIDLGDYIIGPDP